MSWVALRMMTGERSKYIGIVFGVTFASLLMSHQMSIFIGIMRRTTSQIQDVVEADVWAMDPKVRYVDEVPGLMSTNLQWVLRQGAGHPSNRQGSQMDATLDNLTNLTSEQAVRMWARLRRESPVVFSEPADGSPGFWSVTRYKDVQAVLRDHETFGSAEGFKLGMEPESIHRARGKILIASDAPDHTRFRKAFNPMFGPSAIAVLTEKIAQDVRKTVDEALREESFEFVEKIALRVPSQAICAALGAPEEDWKLVAELTNRAFTVSSTAAAAETYYELFLYCVGLVKAARRSNTETPLSKVVEASAGRITDTELVMNLHGIFQAATESTRYSIAGGFAALMERAEQWRALRESPELIPGAVEEILRWTTPAMHTMRKVRKDGMIGDTPVPAGDNLAVWLVSANFDETVFRNPEIFDITRNPNPHVAFGGGRHLCIGARLSRLEITLLLQQLLSRIDSIALVGEPRRVVTKQMQGLDYMPIRPKLHEGRKPLPV